MIKLYLHNHIHFTVDKWLIESVQIGITMYKMRDKN